MKNKIISALFILIIGTLTFTLADKIDRVELLESVVSNQQHKIESQKETIINMNKTIDTLTQEQNDEIEYELSLIEPLKQLDLTKLNYLEKYKQIYDKHGVNIPKSIYQSFTTDELNELFNVVEIEAESGDFINKCNVASVIFNRLDSEEFGDTLDEVLIKSQFSSIKSPKFNHITISNDTILACEYAYTVGDITNGCLYFDSCSYEYHSGYADCQFTDSIGHHFYTKKGDE